MWEPVFDTLTPRNPLSTDNLAELQIISLPGGRPLELILAVPGRRYGDFVELVAPLQSTQCNGAKQEVLGEVPWNKLRLVIAHDPQVAAAAGLKRDAVVAALAPKPAEWVGKLDSQDGSKPSPDESYRAVGRALVSITRSAKHM